MKKPAVSQDAVFAEVAPLIKKAYEVMTSDPNKCISLAQKALIISTKHSFRKGIANGHMHIGLGKYHLGELAAALEEYTLAETMFLEDNDYLGLRSVYNNIGIIYIRWKEREKALEYFQKNLALSEKQPNPQLNCTILANLGGIHQWSGDYQEAVECYNKALTIAREIKFKYGEANALVQLGEQMVVEEKYDEARDYYQQAKQAMEETNHLSGIITYHIHLSQLELRNNNPKLALEHDLAALEIARKINNKHSIAHSALRLAERYNELNDSAMEREYLDICLALASEHNYPDLHAHALHKLAEWLEKAGDYQTALQTYWKYQEIKNVIIDQKRNDLIQQLRVQMQVKEKEKEVELIRKMNVALEKKNRQINRQKSKLEKAEKELIKWNHTLEQRVAEETEKRRKQEQLLIQKSKLESLGRMAAGIAHEINQPLGMISIGIQNLFNKLSTGNVSSEYIADKSSYMTENIERINQIIEHVRLFSRDQQDGKIELLDLRNTVSDSLSMIKTHIKNQNIKLIVHMSNEPVLVLGNRFRLEQVLLNLLNNARDALEDKFDLYDNSKQIAVLLKSKTDKAILEVVDNGCGIPHDKQVQVFEPFYTTKNESKGTGLGLSICYGIVHELGGNLSCKSEAGTGTTMSLELPLVKGVNK